MSAPLIAVVLSWNGREDTLDCLESLRGIPTICVDNGSADGSAEAVAARFPEVELIALDDNLGFSAGNNVGIRRALDRGAEWVLLVNNDATVDAGIAGALARAAALRPDAGVLACKVLFAEPSDVIWFAGGRFSTTLGYSGRQVGYGELDDGRFDRLQDVERASGAAMAVSRAAIERAGLLDERLFAYVEDVDWCLRIRAAGMAVVLAPEARAWHRVSASTGGAGSPTSLYYDTRNTIVVCETHHPLPAARAAARRGLVVAAHIAQAVLAGGRAPAMRMILRGWRDARSGRLGRLRDAA